MYDGSYLTRNSEKLMRYYYLIIIFVLFIITIPALAHTGEAPPSTQEVLAGWANLIGFGLFVGSICFKQFVLQHKPFIPALKSIAPVVGLFLMGIGGILAVQNWSNIMSESAIIILTNPSTKVVPGVSFGVIWGIRALLWFALAGIWWISAHRSRDQWLIFLSITGVFISNLYLHWYADNDQVVYLLIDSIRQMSLGVLVSQMLFMAYAMNDVDFNKVLAFIRTVVLFLVFSTVALGWEDVGQLSLLPYTIHGQVVIIQFLSVLPLALTMRKIQKQGLSAILLIGSTLLVFGITTAVNPAQGKVTWKNYILTQNPVYDIYQDNEMLVQLSMVPGLAGKNEFYLVLIDAQNGSPIDDALVTTKASANQGDLAPFELKSVGDGVYQELVANFSQDGGWNIEVMIERFEHPIKNVNFSVSLPPSPDPASTDLGRGTFIETFSIIFCFVSSIICVTTVGSFTRLSPKFSVSGIQISVFVLSAALCFIGTWILSSLA